MASKKARYYNLKEGNKNANGIVIKVCPNAPLEKRLSEITGASFKSKLIYYNEIDYPICIKGKRACPPEDCGGRSGFDHFLEAITDNKHEEHEDMLAWVGGEFDPEYFDINEVKFDDPHKRWKIAFE